MDSIVRQSGILMPISSLPSPYGIGCLSCEAYEFCRRLSEAGQSVWQILPLTPTSYGDSPYQSPSAFALNPYLIDLCGLIEEGLLHKEECDETLGDAPRDRVDYGRQYEGRMLLYRRAYRRWRKGESAEYGSFLERNETWLSDYALFMAVKERYGGAPLKNWPRGLRERDPQAMVEVREELCESVDFYQFLQFRAWREWDRFHEYAKERGIRIMGDLPLYVSEDSADLWGNPDLFYLNEEGRPTHVAGCPPDAFSSDGQWWGNPLYRWEEHRRRDYSWWVSRLSSAFSLYDMVRIDHFRGFDAYYSIPATAKSAREGRWERGIGEEMFRVAEEILGRREIVAEDLGFETESLRVLLARCGFPGMRILQHGFDTADFSSRDLPHNYPSDCVAYTGTHDNPTLLQWLESRSEEGIGRIREYLWRRGGSLSELGEELIVRLLQSPASLCILPLQDYLLLGEEGRINVPSRGEGNWQWRVKEEELCAPLWAKIERMATVSGRKKMQT